MKERIGSLCLLLSLLATGLLAQAWSGDQSVALQVHDSKGRAVADARVVFTFQGVPGETGPDVVATDGKGHAVLVGLSPGPWQIEVSHADFLSYIAMVDVRRGKKPLVSASFLEAGGRSLSPVKVKFSKGDGKAASPMIEARRPSEAPAEIVTETKPPEEPPFQVAETPTEMVAEAPPPEESPFQIAEAPTPTPVPEQEPVVDPTPMPTEPIAEPITSEPVPAAATEPEVEARPEPAIESPAIVAEEIVAEETESPEPEPVEPVAEIPEQAVEVEVPESAPIAQPEVEPAPKPVLEEEVPEVAVEETAPPEPETAPATAEAIATAAVATPVAESPAPMPEVVPEVERTQPEPEIPSPQPQPSAAPPLPEPAPEPTNEPEMTSMEVVSEAEPVALPTPDADSAKTPSEPPLTAAPATAAAALPPPGDPGSLVTSHRAGTCADCESAEWTLQVSAPAPAVDPTSTGLCGGEVMDVAEQAMQGLATSIQLELEGFIGPIANGTSQEAIRRIEPDLAEPFAGELAEFVGGSSPCQIVGLVLPKEVRFSRVRLGASDQEGVGTCGPGQDCAVGDAQWLGSARVVRGSSATVVWGIFDNRSADKGRRAFMLAYYRPPNSNWKPRLPAMQ